MNPRFRLVAVCLFAATLLASLPLPGFAATIGSALPGMATLPDLKTATVETNSHFAPPVLAHFFESLLDTDGFPPRWQCGTGWTQPLGWLHIISDVMIWGAYFMIPVLLVYFTLKRKDATFHRIYWLFGAFIFACGHTHLIEAMLFYFPAYRLSALFKLITAIVSWATVLVLIPTIPKALALPKLAQLNTQLKAESQARLASEMAAKSRNKDLEMVLSAISHDLREPLRTIHGFAEILGQEHKDALADDPLNCVERIQNAAKRLDQQLEDLLKLSRLNRASFGPCPLVLEELVEIVTDRLEERIQATQATITVEKPLPACVADPVWVTEAIHNLLTNALKFIKPGTSPEITIQGVTDEANGLAGLVILDRGIGIRKETSQRIFEMFRRDAPKDIEGTGAGLAIVRRVADRHNGQATAAPREGGGSAFGLLLPKDPATFAERLQNTVVDAPETNEADA